MNNKKTIIALCGWSCTGKTTLTKIFEELLVSNNSIVFLHADDFIKKHHNNIEEKIILELENFKNGKSKVMFIDSYRYLIKKNSKFLHQYCEQNFNLIVLQTKITCSFEEYIKRILSRGKWIDTTKCLAGNRDDRLKTCKNIWYKKSFTKF